MNAVPPFDTERIRRLALLPVAGVMGLSGVRLGAAQLDIRQMIALGQATVTNSPIDIGTIQNVFDRNTNTLARSQAVNPMVVTMSFSQSKRLSRSRVWFLGQDNRWRVETADTLADLDSGTGSFLVVLDWETGAQATWHDRTIADPAPCKFVRLKLNRLTGDDYVHLND